MRTPMATIREAILSPMAAVRREALSYFADSYATDPTLMPLVIRAVEQYGWRESYDLLTSARNLVQTSATVDWLATELGKDWDLDDIAADNYRFTLALILCEAPVELLRLRPELRDLPCFPEELDELLEDRLDMDRWSTAVLWTEFEELGLSLGDMDDIPRDDDRRCERFAEALARWSECKAAILQLLHRRYRGYDKSAMMQVESTLVDAAGRMRLEEAVPLLVDRLHEDDFDVADASERALRRIGSDAVVRAIAEQWPAAKAEFREWAVGVLEHIPGDAAAEHCLGWFAWEKDRDRQMSLAHAILGQFVPDALETIRRLARMSDDDPELTDLQDRLSAACTIMGVSFPEREAWLREAENRRRQDPPGSSVRLRDAWEPDMSCGDPEEGEDDFSDAEDSDAEDSPLEGAPSDRFDNGAGAADPYRMTPIRRDTPDIGRNAPCPCGSGRKYKKCCMANDRNG
jgi:hypothetical protein